MRINSLLLCWTLASIGSVAVAEDSSEPAAKSDRPLTIREQRESMMRGDANGREIVPIQRSSPEKIAKGEITFDDLKFDIEKGQPFAPEQLNDIIRSLAGRKVQLRGYILPTTLYREKGIDQFVLVRDNLECCFGPGAALFDCVMVEMKGGATTDYVVRPVSVEGMFVVDPEKYKYPGGKGPDGSSHLSIFRIEGVRVR